MAKREREVSMEGLSLLCNKDKKKKDDNTEENDQQKDGFFRKTDTNPSTNDNNRQQFDIMANETVSLSTPIMTCLEKNNVSSKKIIDNKDKVKEESNVAKKVRKNTKTKITNAAKEETEKEKDKQHQTKQSTEKISSQTDSDSDILSDKSDIRKEKINTIKSDDSELEYDHSSDEKNESFVVAKKQIEKKDNVKIKKEKISSEESDADHSSDEKNESFKVAKKQIEKKDIVKIKKERISSEESDTDRSSGEKKKQFRFEDRLKKQGILSDLEDEHKKNTDEESDREITLIGSLVKFKKVATIKARCIKISNLRTTSKKKSSFKYFIDLKDSSSSTLRLIALNDIDVKYYHLFELNKLFYIYNGVPKPPNDIYNKETKFEMHLSSNMKIEECLTEDKNIAHMKLEFTKIEKIVNKKPNDLINVIAIIKQIGQLRSVRTKNGKEKPLRKVSLFDDSGFIVNCSFWDEDADSEVLNGSNEFSTVLLIGVSVSNYNEKTLNAQLGTRIIINPKESKAIELKKWFKRCNQDETLSHLVSISTYESID